MKSGAGKTQLPRLDIINPVKHEPFDDQTGEWTFDFKYDGFRGVLYKNGEHARFRSKEYNVMNRFKNFAERAARTLKCEQAIVDGEIVVLDESERPIFNAMLRKGSAHTYIAFDLLWLNGEDLRTLPLRERRKLLRRILPRRSRIVKPAFSIKKQGKALFQSLCEHDLEGMVAKRLQDPYGKRTKWYKIKNPKYSQALGREKIFNRRRS